MLRIFLVMALMAGGLAVNGVFADDNPATQPTVFAESPTGDNPQAPVVNAEVPAAVAEPVAQPEPQAQPAVMEYAVNASGNVTLDFREADIKNVLKVLAYKAGVNIIAGPEVVGVVNIQLKNLPWQKALDVILSTYGYSYEQRGSVIMVTTAESLKKRREDAKVLADQEPLTTETYILNFSKAEDVVKSMDRMTTIRGSINFNKRTNAVIVTDVASNLGLIREVIARLDAITPQVMIEARIIETALNNQETLGIKWPTSIGGAATFPMRTHTFPWSTARDTYLPSTSYVNPSDVDGTFAKTTDVATTLLTYGTLNVNSLNMTLDMLKSRTNTNVLSNPKIVTLDNQQAEINVGNKYPLPKYSYSDTQDRLTISGWEYIEYGLTFKVTPHVNGKDVVTIDIEPVIMDSSSSVPFAFGGAATTDVPILTTESAKTSVMIRDGETLVIAGLIKDKKTKITSKVPILGDIPILGLIFRHKNDAIVKTELIIFLTPHIITVAPEQKVEAK